MKNPFELLGLKKESRQEQAANDKKEIIPIREESGGIIKDREGLIIERQDQTIIKEHLDLNDQGFENTPTKEKKDEDINNIPDEYDMESEILDKIDGENSEKNTDEEIESNETYGPKNNKPKKWAKITSTREIKKMVPKKSKKESVEKAA